EFLSRSGLAEQQHRGITGRDCLDQLQDLSECGAVADDLMEVHLARNLFFEIKLLLGQLVFELRNLLAREGVLQHQRYLTANPGHESKLIRTVRIGPSSDQSERAHNPVAA